MPPKITLTITFFSTKKPNPGVIPASNYCQNPSASTYSHLNSIELTNVNGNISFENLLPHIQTYYPYWIPSVWPTPIVQRGYCCGLYALEVALQYANPQQVIPPARKNGDRSQPSLRQIAKEKGYSAFGEIFNVTHLQKIAEIAGYYTCQALRFKIPPFAIYRNKICLLLQRGYSVIVSCDLGGAHDTPSQAKGNEAHWALIFGFFYFKNHCYFLVTQYGKYYIWSAATLYESNLALPQHNPRSGPIHVYHKNKKSGEEFFIQVDEALSPDILKSGRYCLTETLTDFQFTSLATPTAALTKSLQLESSLRLTSADIQALDPPPAHVQNTVSVRIKTSC